MFSPVQYIASSTSPLLHLDVFICIKRMEKLVEIGIFLYKVYKYAKWLQGVAILVTARG
jgi:hypothetical protein